MVYAFAKVYISNFNGYVVVKGWPSFSTIWQPDTYNNKMYRVCKQIQSTDFQYYFTCNLLTFCKNSLNQTQKCENIVTHKCKLGTLINLVITTFSYSLDMQVNAFDLIAALAATRNCCALFVFLLPRNLHIFSFTISNSCY